MVAYAYIPSQVVNVTGPFLLIFPGLYVHNFSLDIIFTMGVKPPNYYASCAGGKLIVWMSEFLCAHKSVTSQLVEINHSSK